MIFFPTIIFKHSLIYQLRLAWVIKISCPLTKILDSSLEYEKFSTGRKKNTHLFPIPIQHFYFFYLFIFVTLIIYRIYRSSLLFLYLTTCRLRFSSLGPKKKRFSGQIFFFVNYDRLSCILVTWRIHIFRGRKNT